MPTRFALALGAVLLALAACKHKEEVVVQKEDIPREIAVGNLRTLLPRCLEVLCTMPKETLKQSDIREWVVGNDGLEIRPTRARPMALNFADITQTRVEKSGSKYYVKVYTAVQKDPSKEHFTFVWASEEGGTNADQLFEAVRKK